MNMLLKPENFRRLVVCGMVALRRCHGEARDRLRSDGVEAMSPVISQWHVAQHGPLFSMQNINKLLKYLKSPKVVVSAIVALRRGQNEAEGPPAQ